LNDKRFRRRMMTKEKIKEKPLLINTEHNESELDRQK
jgi:hypothetical protein